MNILSENYWRGSQSLESEIIVSRTEDERRFKVKLDRDSYDTQSSVETYVWTEVGWSAIFRRPINFYEIGRFSYTCQDSSWQVTAKKDMHKALSEAFNIVPKIAQAT